MESAVEKTAMLKNRGRRNLIVCFSHLRWNFVFQRPQHLLKLASKDQDVIYFEEPIFEGTAFPLCRIHVEDRIRIVTPVVPIGTTQSDAEAVQREFVDQIIADNPYSRLTAWYYTPMALSFTEHIVWDICVYDCMDELSAFRNAPAELGAMEEMLLSRADVVFTGGQSLYEAKRCLHPSIFPFPSSIDREHFYKARRRCEDPLDQKDIPHPRIGYFGVIDERLDLEMVAQAISIMPDVNFVMLGPVVKIDPTTLPQGRNLHWLGCKSYTDLPHYLRHWDAGWMPFSLNEATRYISPTKTPEFLAAGLPVISTAIVDVVRTYGAEGLVDIFDKADLEIKLRSAISRPRKEFLEKVDVYLADMSWEKTWQAMSNHVENAYLPENVIPFRRRV